MNRKRKIILILSLNSDMVMTDKKNLKKKEKKKKD